MSHFHDCPKCEFEYQCDSDWPQEYCPELDNDNRLCIDCKEPDEGDRNIVEAIMTQPERK